MRKYILIIILLSIAVYANSASSGFVWDDEFLILDNPSIMSWNYTWIHFVLDLYHSFSNYYRPVQMITYMIDFSFWRFYPFGYHLTNILLHALLSAIFFLFLFLISKDKKIAFIGAVLYTAHPANTGAVAYVAGRADILAAIFTLLSLIFFDAHFKANNPRKTVSYYIASLFSFLLALLSKEVAVIAGMLAAEIGANRDLAKRGALLHDIGKGVESDSDQNHAEIGMELARKLGEDPRVVNAIGSHHADVEPICIESVLCQIADATGI